MHENIRRAIGTGWTEREWRQVALAHPVFRLYLQHKQADAHRLLREYSAAHEAGHVVMAMVVGARVHRAEVASLHEIEESGTLGFAEYSFNRRAHPGVLGEVLLDLAGIAGHEVIYNNGWGLDAAAWTEPDAVGSLRGEARVGGDLYEARERVKRSILAGFPVLGKANTADALVAAFEQAEGILAGNRGRLLAFAGRLLSHGKIDRSVIKEIWDRGEE